MFFITIEQVKYFLAINKYKSFSLASEELCISQSSLSKQIKSLEDKLGTKLINRTTRSISLTEAGKEFLIHGQKLVNEYHCTLNAMRKYNTKEEYTLRIGAIPVISQYGIISLIAKFNNQYPNVNIEVIEGERDDVINMMNKNDIDFAFLRDFNMDNEYYDISPLISDELVLVTSENHPFSSKKYISLEESKNENFIMLSAKSGIDKFAIDECIKCGFTPNITYSVNKIETILGLVSEGFGVTLLMNKVISSFNKSNLSINLLKKPSTNSLSLIYKKNNALSKNQILFKKFIENNIYDKRTVRKY